MSRIPVPDDNTLLLALFDENNAFVGFQQQTYFDVLMEIV